MPKRLNCFCDKYDVFHDSQNAFRKKRYFILAAYRYMDKTINILNEKITLRVILLDMIKAYDKVQFDTLLRKLYDIGDIGIRDVPLQCFTSYLYNPK